MSNQKIQKQKKNMYIDKIIEPKVKITIDDMENKIIDEFTYEFKKYLLKKRG